MEEKQLLQAGEDAHALLNDPAFNRVVDALVDSTFQAFVNTNPDEAQERERAYHHYRGLTDVVSTLKQQVEVRDQILANKKKAQDHE